MASSRILPNLAVNKLNVNRLNVISLKSNNLNILENLINEELFKYGVASGDPYQNSVVIWSKLDYDELSKLGLLKDNINIEYFISLNEDFSNILQTDNYNCSIDNDFSIKIIIENLEPDTYYYYKFKLNNNESIIGRTRTLPENIDNMKLNFTSCSNIQHGKDNNYKKMLEEAETEDHNLWCHLGDIIYEAEYRSIYQSGINKFTGIEYEANIRPENIPKLNLVPTESGRIRAVTVEEYRNIWKQYFNYYPYLKKLLSRFPLLWILDDHEVCNNFRGLDPQAPYDVHIPSEDGALLERKMNAYKVIKEFLPIGKRGYSENLSDDLFSVNKYTSFYTSRNFGNISKWIILDTRSLSTGPFIDESTYFNIDYLKTISASEAFNYLYENYDKYLEELKNPERNILGSYQDEWLKKEIENTNLENIVIMNSNTTNTMYGNKSFEVASLLTIFNVVNNLNDLIGISKVVADLLEIFGGSTIVSGETAPILSSDNIGNGFIVSRERIHNLLKDNNKKYIYLSGDIHQANVWIGEYSEFVTNSCSSVSYDRYYYGVRSLIQNTLGKEPISSLIDFFDKTLNINGRIFADSFNRGFNKIILRKENIELKIFGTQIYNQDPPWEFYENNLNLKYVTKNFIYENWEEIKEM